MVQAFNGIRLLAALGAKLPSPKNAGKLLGGSLAVIGCVVLIYTILHWLGFPTSFTGSWLGVPFDVSILTFVMMVLFWVDGNIYIQKHHMGLSERSYNVASAVIAVVVVGSVVVHEIAHGIVATAFGNHIDHAGISWWGAFVAPSVTLHEMSPIEQMLIAAAGPLSNYALGAIAALFVWRYGESLVENTVQYIAVANIRMGRLNLIPFLFLDGGKVLDGFLRLFIVDQSTRTIVGVVCCVVILVMYRAYRKVNPEAMEDRLAKI